MEDWKKEAYYLYFEEGLGVGEAAARIGISRQSVSAYLKACPGFAEEKERRKAGNKIKRKAYKKEKNREYRNNYRMQITQETIRREHDIAAMLLSHER